MTEPPEQSEIELDHIVAAELETLPDLGEEIDEGGFVVRAGNQPIAHSLTAIYSALGKPAPPLAVRLYERFQVRIVPHRISVIRKSGLAEPTSVGIEVEYLSDDATCCVIGLLPSFEYTEHGNLDLGVSTRISGHFSPTGEIMPMAPGAEAGDGAIQIGSLSCGLSGKAAASLNFQATVATPSVAAVGIGSNHAEWRFNRQKEPLFGRDIETWSTLVIPANFRELKYRMRFSITTRTLFFPTRRESDWIDLTCIFGGE